MKFFASALLLSGIFLMGLGGFEKILIFSSFGGKMNTLQLVINYTPRYFWNITNVTFWFGLLFCLVALGSLVIAVFSRKPEKT